MKLHLSLSAIALAITSTVASAANWQVNNEQSQLSFISVKKADIAEIHRFAQFQGQLEEQGNFSLEIDLSSVDTGIEIRDSRMKEFLFDVEQYPVAKVTASVDPKIVSELEVGESASTTIEGQLALHGQSQKMTFDTLVTKKSDTELLVVSAQPVIVNVPDFKLNKGVDKLKELAGLPSISYAVPVSFYLTLNADK